ncbi:hypothetical protein BDF22DRAFT_678271 [Syncephalis plumigaleata]|nr:hypothetical protein BDF22DRAFT_678271 [Syncephalis plumigaleata]
MAQPNPTTDTAAQNPLATSVEKVNGIVVVDFAQLAQDPLPNLSASLQEAFGNHSEALGVILVRGIPDYPGLRSNLLKQASVFAQLPDDIKERLTVPAAQFSFGWSHGKEVMNGKPDTEKGSFYANPLNDKPGEQITDEKIRQEYVSYYHGNVWPTAQECPAFEQDFKALGTIIAATGYLLGRHCDAYAQSYVPNYTPGFVANALQSSDTTKARLLHYFPSTSTAAAVTTTASTDDASWCGWHLDHSLLTGLTRAMYVDETTDYREIATPDPLSGLYIKKRSGQVVQVDIPEDMVAFQAGEALQLATAGQLQGTWHCVRAPKQNPPQQPSARIARNTFAVFLQPPVAQLLNSEGLTFGQFSRQVLDRHY